MSDFERVAESYARFRTIHPGVLEALIVGAELTAESRVLEVGCGTGNYLRAVIAQTGCSGEGVEPSPAMLEQARRHLGTYVQGRAEELPQTDASFDLVFTVDVIHHVADRPAYFREARRVLKPGGSICTVTDSPDIIRTRKPMAEYFPETVAANLAKYPAIETLRGEMEAAGFPRQRVETAMIEFRLADASMYRERVFSALRDIPDEAWRRGLERLERDLVLGPIHATSRYTLVWAVKPRG